MIALVAPNDYLDRRLPTWLVFERAGIVRYDPMTRLVTIDAGAIEITEVMRGTCR